MTQLNVSQTALAPTMGNHLSEKEFQATEILNSLIDQTLKDDCDEAVVQGLIRKYEQLMS